MITKKTNIIFFLIIKVVKKMVGKALALWLIFSPLLLMAADGERPIGYGMKSKGMGGVGVALPQDSLINGMNPAGMSFLESRFDIGPQYLKYRPSGRIRDNAVAANNQSFSADMDTPLLDLGYTQQFCDNWSAGFSFYQNGGSLNYGKSLHALGTSKVLALYEHFILTPAVAWRILPNQSIGFGVNIALGRLKVNGIENEKLLSLFPNNVTNRKSDYESGVGFRIGWMGKLFPGLSFGLAYSSKVWYHHFDKYKGFLPDKGNGHLPDEIMGGITYELNSWVFAFDVHRIYWSHTIGFGNRLNLQFPLGAKHASGLGWKDQTSYKIGIAYNYNCYLTLRIGASLATDVLPRNQTLSNIIVNLIQKDHVTWGATWTWGPHHEFTFAYLHAFRHTIKGKNSIPLVQGGGEVDLSAEEDFFGFSYGYIF